MNEAHIFTTTYRTQLYTKILKPLIIITDILHDHVSSLVTQNLIRLPVTLHASQMQKLILGQKILEI